MHRRTRTILATAGVLALPLGLVTTAQAQAQADITIRGTSSDVTGQYGKGGRDVVLDRSTANGSWQFLADGIRMDAPTVEDRAGVYWDIVGDELPASASLEWNGTQKGDNDEFADPAIVIFFDVDGDGPVGRDALLMEEIYGENDAWLAGGSEAAQAAAPDTNAGSGSAFSGPLDEWKTNLEADNPDLEVLAVGVNLSTEQDGPSSGTVESVTLGSDTYRFTNAGDPEPVQRNVNGASDVERDGRSVDITFRAQDQPANSVEGNRLRWRVAVVGESSTSFVQGFGDVDSWTRTFRRNTGTYTVRVFKNGDKVRELTIRTNG